MLELYQSCGNMGFLLDGRQLDGIQQLGYLTKPAPSTGNLEFKIITILQSYTGG